MRRNHKTAGAYWLFVLAFVFQPVLSAFAPFPVESLQPNQVTETDEQSAATSGPLILDGPFGVEIDTFTGGLHYERTDLSFPCPMPLQASVSYDTLRADVLSFAGFYGWQFGEDVSYASYTHKQLTGEICAAVLYPPGKAPEGGGCTPTYDITYGIVVRWESGGETYFQESDDGTYISTTGVDDILTSPETGKYLLTLRDGTRYYFDSDRHKHVNRIIQPGGEMLIMEYNSDALLSTVTDSAGRQLDLTYAQDGEHFILVGVSDPTSTPPRTIVYGYDEDQNLTSITDPTGATTFYEYNGEHYLTRITSPLGDSLDIEYDDQKRVVGLTTPLSGRFFSYLDEENRTLIADVMGPDDIRETTVTYDSRGHMLEITDPVGGTTKYGWAAGDLLTSFINPYNTTTRYGYDGAHL